MARGLLTREPGVRKLSVWLRRRNAFRTRSGTLGIEERPSFFDGARLYGEFSESRGLRRLDCSAYCGQSTELAKRSLPPLP